MACRLTYFNFKALGEPIRMMLTYAGIPFEDIRLDRHGPQWTEKKPNYPMGQLPLLEIDGLKLHQSKVICRYLAKKINLYGTDIQEQAEIDIAADIVYDLIMKMRVLRDIDDLSVQTAKYETFKTTAIPYFLQNLDELAKTNKGYLACCKLSWADFYFAGAIEYLEHLCRMKFTDQYDNLKRVVNNIHGHPKLKQYMIQRPNTDY